MTQLRSITIHQLILMVCNLIAGYLSHIRHKFIQRKTGMQVLMHETNLFAINTTINAKQIPWSMTMTELF